MADQKQDVLANYLASALDMEDEIANSVYKDYILANNWPHSLRQDAFEKIKEYLTTLIEDTQRHRKTIAALIDQYDRSKKQH